jgi:hypothetical protein
MIFKEAFFDFFFIPLLFLFLFTAYHLLFRKFSASVQWLVVLILTSYYVFLIGFRDISIGADSIVYLSLPAELAEMFNGKDKFFLLLHHFFFTIGGEDFLFVFFSLFLFLLIIINSYLLSPQEIIIPFASFLISVSFVAFSVNVLRQGLSIYCFILFLSLRERKRFLLATLFLFVSVALHRFTLVLASVFLAVYLLKNNYLKFIGLLLMVGIAMDFQNVQHFVELNEIYDFSYEDRLLEEFDLTLGINWSMIIFNLVFIIQMSILYFRVNSTMSNNELELLFFSFLFLTLVFIISMNFPYSDRIGQLSWSIIPLFLIFLSRQIKKSNVIFKYFLFFDLTLLVNLQFYFLFLKS